MPRTELVPSSEEEVWAARAAAAPWATAAAAWAEPRAAVGFRPQSKEASPVGCSPGPVEAEGAQAEATGNKEYCEGGSVPAEECERSTCCTWSAEKGCQVALPVPEPVPTPAPVPKPAPAPAPVPAEAGDAQDIFHGALDAQAQVALPVPEPVPSPAPVPNPVPAPSPVPAEAGDAQDIFHGALDAQVALPVPEPVPVVSTTSAQRPAPVPNPVPAPSPALGACQASCEIAGRIGSCRDQVAWYEQEGVADIATESMPHIAIGCEQKVLLVKNACPGCETCGSADICGQTTSITQVEPSYV